MSEQTIARLVEDGAIPSFEDVRDFDDIQQRFLKAARQIILEHELVCGACRWQISELELYLYTGSYVWRDDTTHCSSEQLKCGTWYVHHYRNGNWRPPNRSGIDLTVGCEHEKTFGGILIRQICNRGGSGTAFKTIVREPLKLAMSNLKWSDYEREQIIRIHGTCAVSGFLRLERSEKSRPASLWIGPRIGLKGKKCEAARLRVSTQKGIGELIGSDN